MKKNTDQLVNKLLTKFPKINDWIKEDFIGKHNLINWNDSIDKVINQKRR